MALKQSFVQSLLQGQGAVQSLKYLKKTLDMALEQAKITNANWNYGQPIEDCATPPPL